MRAARVFTSLEAAGAPIYSHHGEWGALERASCWFVDRLYLDEDRAGVLIASANANQSDSSYSIEEAREE